MNKLKHSLSTSVLSCHLFVACVIFLIVYILPIPCSYAWTVERAARKAKELNQLLTLSPKVSHSRFSSQETLCAFEQFRVFGKGVWHVAGFLLAQTEMFHASAACTPIALWMYNQFYYIFKSSKVKYFSNRTFFPPSNKDVKSWMDNGTSFFFFIIFFFQVSWLFLFLEKSYFSSSGFEWPWQMFIYGK